MRTLAPAVLLALSCLHAEEPLRIAMFKADATPEIGMPVVLCAVDWIGIGNGGHDEWRRGLAEAAGTTMECMTAHTLHQHDGVRCDLTAENLLAKPGLGGTRMDAACCRKVIASTAEAVREALMAAMLWIENSASDRKP